MNRPKPVVETRGTEHNAFVLLHRYVAAMRAAHRESEAISIVRRATKCSTPEEMRALLATVCDLR